MEIAVLIPCYNEATTIQKVIHDFRLSLPSAKIYVCDNNSKDNTLELATAAGAIVQQEFQQGKGNAIRRMFADIEADIYIMVDGDATYDASIAPSLIEQMVSNRYDMINIARVSQAKEAYRFGHSWGNSLLTGIVSKIFGKRFNDMLSGYRFFSRRFVKSFPCHSTGFEIETELTVYALSLRMPILEVTAPYYARPEGSFSKLSTYKDGFRIIRMIFNLVRKEKPLFFFNIFAVIFILAALTIGLPVIIHYFHTGLVPRLPSAVLAASLIILAFLSFTCGLILDTVTRGRQEIKRFFYLSHVPLRDKLQ